MTKPTEETEGSWIYVREKEYQSKEGTSSRDSMEFMREKMREVLEEEGFSDFKFSSSKAPIPVPVDPSGDILKLSEEIIDKFAKKMDITSGKWVIFPPKEEVDEAWESIKELAEENKIDAKVSTKKQVGEKGHYVICVYTENYLDKEKTMEIREELRKKGFTETLYYKPDLYSILRIYHKTAKKFGLKGASRYRK